MRTNHGQNDLEEVARFNTSRRANMSDYLAPLRSGGTLGRVVSVNKAIEASQGLHDAASSAQGLSEVFQAISQCTPLVLNILRSFQKTQEQNHDEYTKTTDDSRKSEIEDSDKSFKPLMVGCREDAEQLQEIFKKVVTDDAFVDTAERHKKIARARVFGVTMKVRDLMVDILDRLQAVLDNQPSAQHSELQKENNKELANAISQLLELPLTPPEDLANDTRFGRAGDITIGIDEGSWQNFYNIGSGRSSQGGSQYNRDFSFGTSNFEQK